MRRYPPNSPLAAARVVALTMVADGTICRGELHSLARLDVYERLNLDAVQMQQLLDELARDLFEFGAPAWDGSGGLHPLIMNCVLEDVSNPELRETVLEICRDIAQADSRVTDGERALLILANTQWRAPTCSRSLA
jgi:hypothetical protein